MKNKGGVVIIQNERPPNLITGPHHRTVGEQGMGRSALEVLSELPYTNQQKGINQKTSTTQYGCRTLIDCQLERCNHNQTNKMKEATISLRITQRYR
jgi:hypothetical protein